MTYKLHGTGVSLDGRFIPADPQNQDYRTFLQWVADGNSPEDADPLPGVAEGNSKATNQRARTDAIDSIERKMAAGASIEDTIKSVLQLLKGQP